MDKYDFAFRGCTASSYGICIEKRPDMPVGREDPKFVTIAGRDSPLTIRTGERENIEISLSCGFVEDRDLWNEKVRKIRSWLSGEGELIFTDSADFYWKVRDIEIKKIVRTTKRMGKFDLIFICDPYEYLESGKMELGAKEAAYNPYQTSHPVYTISGNGTCALTVNGKTMKATVGQNLTIDTDRMMAYRVDGSMNNTAVNGDYEDLYLKPGENTITITSGFGLKVIPNWRCL